MASSLGPSYQWDRRRLVEQLQASGITDALVLRAFELTPRHLFVPSGMRHHAYKDSAIPIGSKQYISQPSIQARYLQLLQLTGKERVLEIGTGSGYQTVLLSHVAEQVFSIERVPSLLEGARAAIRECGARNISLQLGDGTIGWREYAPYDAILVAAAGPEVPMPLAEQLAVGGRMLVPVGESDDQMLTMVTRLTDSYERRDIVPVKFVPLLGTHGWTTS